MGDLGGGHLPGRWLAGVEPTGDTVEVAQQPQSPWPPKISDTATAGAPGWPGEAVQQQQEASGGRGVGKGWQECLQELKQRRDSAGEATRPWGGQRRERLLGAQGGYSSCGGHQMSVKVVALAPMQKASCATSLLRHCSQAIRNSFWLIPSPPT